MTTTTNPCSEFDTQANIFSWARMSEAAYPDLKYLFSTMNGIKLPIGLAVKAVRGGAKKGTPDIWLPTRRGKYAGLVIELKVGKNKPTPEQIDWMAYLNSQGYYAHACWGFEQTIETIQNYLEGRM